MVLCIGAVQGATLGFYHQKHKRYEWHRKKHPMEIVSGIGNVSMKDRRLFLHLHVSLSDSRGRVCGGHLSSPTPVFACEVFVRTTAQGLVRKYDRQTGLFLW